MVKALFATVLASAFFSLAFSVLQRRVYNGQEAKENEFPYMVNVLPPSVRCGGVLLSNRYVLTAAHCLMDVVLGQNITLVLGGRNYYADGPNTVVFKADMKFWIHENFSMPSAANDVAIIQLPRPVDLSEQIKPIEMSTDKEIDEERREVVAITMGYGATQKSDRASTLQAATMKLIPISDCLKYQPHFIENITTHHICVIGVHTSKGHGVGPCDGDSGKQILFSLPEVHHTFVVAQDRRWCLPRRGT